MVSDAHGVETASHRQIYNASRVEYTEIFDLKAAYESVLSEKLVEPLAKKLSKTTVKATRTMFQGTKIGTCADI